MKTKSGKPLFPVGIGTWSYGEYPVFSPGHDAEVDTIRYSLSFGQNHIDTAELYAKGGAETVVGHAIQPFPRQDIFIASKIWKHNVGLGLVRPAVLASLKRLDTDYLDMLYIHAPWFDAPWQEAVAQIDDLIDEGLVRHFGVSNFKIEHLRPTLATVRHKIAANQVHFSVAHQDEASEELRGFCRENGIEVVAYSPLERGNLSEQTNLKSLAAKYQATPEQIALAWLISKGTLPIPKASSKQHIERNIAGANVRLSAEDSKLIDKYK